MIFLAESSTAMPDVSPGFFRDWVAVAVFVIGFGSLIYSRITSRRVRVEPSPVPVQVQQAPAFATKEQHDDLVERMDRFEEKIERHFKDLKESRSEDIQNLHRHIESTSGKMESHMRELVGMHQDALKTSFDRIDGLSTRVGRLEGRIDQPPKGGRS